MSLLFWTYFFAKIDLWSTVIGDLTGTVSHSVRGGMCWNKLLCAKGFVFTLLTRSLKGERRVLYCKYNNKINLFHQKWSIHSPKQKKTGQNLNLTLNSSMRVKFKHGHLVPKRTYNFLWMYFFFQSISHEEKTFICVHIG